MRWILAVFLLACSAPKPVATIADRYEEFVEIPKYIEPSGGTATPVEGGILLDEEKAIAVAELRIGYEELYRASVLNNAAASTIISIADRELQDADKRMSECDTWWNRHKLEVGIVTGVVLGAAGTLGAGAIWSKLSEP